MKLYPDSTILVTGGAGFVGSHLCDYYLERGHRVICVDNLQTTQSKKNINHLRTNAKFKFIKHDITKPLTVSDAIDWVFNFACSGSPAIYQYDPVHTAKTNSVGTLNMLNLALKHKAGFVQASTSEVYGDPLESPQIESYRGNVSPIGPRACYDEGKRFSESLCFDFYREYHMPLRMIRIFNTYGPRMDQHDGRAVTNFITNAIKGKQLVIYGDGSATRSFMYIEDLIRGIDALVNQEKIKGPVNLGNPNELTIKEFAQQIIRTTGSPSQIEYVEAATDDPQRRVPDISMAKKYLDWEPRISLEEGLDKTIEYFRKTRDIDEKVLVFTTTYKPDLGPAEKKIAALTEQMSDTEFHIITSRFRKGLPRYEQQNNEHIHRIGLGATFDKYALPLLGAFRAVQLHKQHDYHFMWSAMASYAGLAGLLKKKIRNGVQYLLLLDDSELNRAMSPAERHAFRLIRNNADAVFMPSEHLEKTRFTSSRPITTSSIPEDIEQFKRKVLSTYTDIYYKKTGRLSRFK